MRFLFTLAIASLLPIPSATASAAPVAAQAGTRQATALAERYLSWRGGNAFARLRDFHVVASVDYAGLKGTTSEWRTRDGRSRDEFDLGVTKGLSVRTPKAGWDKNDALVTPAGHYSLEGSTRQLGIEFGDALRAKDVVRERLPDEEIDGRRWAILRIKFDDADSYDLILDPSTGALHGHRYIIDGRTNFTRLSDWRIVNGVRFPFLLEGYRPNGKLDYTETVQSIETNRNFAAALFERPDSEHTLAFAPGAHSTGAIRYNPYTGTRIYIPAKVNGRDVEVLLDSGADSSVLDKGFAESIGKTKIGSSVATGSGGEQESGYANDIAIQIGNMTLNLPTVSVVDLASVGKRIGIPLPVILGKDVFLQSVVEIDPAGPTIAFHEPASFTPPAGATLVELDPITSLDFVPVSVEGIAAAPMVLDLGNGGYMTLTPYYWQQHKLLDGRKTSTRSSGAVGGEKINQVGTLKTVRFAGVTFHDVPAEFTAPNVELTSKRRAGNIGMPILGRFRMMIDMQNNRMWVIPIADRIDAPFDRDRAGLRAVQEGDRLVVKYVSTGSPAEAAGWKAGDIITAIDGTRIGPGFASSELSKWAMRPQGTVIALSLADGTVRKLTLADYF
jgi:hypothetical protein